MSTCFGLRTKELIGLTTNHEHGYWLGLMPEKVVYGRPDDSYRNTYLDLMYEFDALQSHRPKATIHKTLAETVTASIEKAKENRSLGLIRIPSKIKVESPYGEFCMDDY